MESSIAKRSKSEYNSRINRVIDHVKNNLDQDLSLEQLATVGLFSKYYFHRVFKAISGENVNDFVNRTRLENSAFLLKHRTNSSITSIAYDVGFSSPSTYARAFKKHFSMTPSQWRKQQKSNIGTLERNNEQMFNNSCKDDSQVTLYIDSRTKTPKWRINMNDSQMLNVKVQTMPDIHVAYVRHRGQYQPSDKALFQGMFAKLINWAVPRNLFMPPETKAMTVYSSGHPDVTAADKLAVDVCISVDKDTKIDGEIGKRVLTGGQYAVISLNEATMEQCGQAWEQLFNHWLPQSGYQPGDGSYYCQHLNDPEQHPKKLYDVEMYLPVKPL